MRISVQLTKNLIVACVVSLTTLRYSNAQDTSSSLFQPTPPPLTLDELARKAQNPISDVTSALMENGFNFGVGPSNGLNYILNMEEFYPVRVIDELRLVQRFIVPVAVQPELTPGQGGTGGLGDIQYQAYVTSVNTTGLIFGLGPIVSVPTAYPNELGSGKWSAGPTTAAVFVGGDWVLGVLLNQLWSISSYNDRPPVSQMQIQPLINFNFPNAWYLSSSPVITANWKAAGGDRWTVPVGGGIGKVFRVSKQAIKAELQGFYSAVSPQQGPDWSTRLQFQFLFPSEKENKPSM